MVKIISMSLSEAMLREIDELEKTGFSGRSDVIRSGVKMLIDDMKEKERLRGHGECVLIFMHNKKFENAFIKTKHKYEGIISTQVHSNLCNDKCLELFVLHGQSEKISEFLSDVRKNKRTDYVKLVVP
ncbi:MAG: CopG family ribbon-helix-helix protein [Candidatus Aenigmatarchaeota archaeon]